MTEDQRPRWTDRLFREADGFLFTSQRLRTETTVRPSAALLISACGTPFSLRVGDETRQATAAVIAPHAPRSLHACGVRLVSLNVHPTHDAWLSVQAVAPRGLLPLPREAFAFADARLLALGDGALTPAEGSALYAALVAAMLAQLPCRIEPSPMRRALLARWAREPDVALATLAQEFGLSYHRMSKVFAEAVGLPYRSFRLADRMVRASRTTETRATLTAIAHATGFTDSAHLTRAVRRRYGLTPSEVRDAN